MILWDTNFVSTAVKSEAYPYASGSRPYRPSRCSCLVSPSPKSYSALDILRFLRVILALNKRARVIRTHYSDVYRCDIA
jgi:hypothetical protein